MSKAEGATLVRPAHSAVFLARGSELVRLPRAPKRPRSRAFRDQFEHRALFYDCFWHHDGNDVLLVGPPPLNLQPHYEAARYCAIPSGIVLLAKYFPSRSSMSTRLTGVPSGTTHIILNFAGEDHEIAVQPSLVKQLAGSRMLFTMNKDNDLGWIADWAHYHATIHQADTIVLFDNGSARYGLDELEKTLAGIPGLRNIVLISWPYRFGHRDNRVFAHHYWAHFLQISSMNVVLRRMGMAARAILNCDIDELVAPLTDSHVFELALNSHKGLAALEGQWVESVIDRQGNGSSTTADYRHGDFSYIRRDPTSRLCPKKWALDPKRDWVKGLDVFPYWHRIMGAPDRKITEKPVGGFWHFHGINTGWKQTRQHAKLPRGLLHKRSRALQAALARYDKARQKQS